MRIGRLVSVIEKQQRLVRPSVAHLYAAREAGLLVTNILFPEPKQVPEKFGGQARYTKAHELPHAVGISPIPNRHCRRHPFLATKLGSIYRRHIMFASKSRPHSNVRV
jgi:hypothetical protein